MTLWSRSLTKFLYTTLSVHHLFTHPFSEGRITFGFEHCVLGPQGIQSGTHGIEVIRAHFSYPILNVKGESSHLGLNLSPDIVKKVRGLNFVADDLLPPSVGSLACESQVS
jgi:hypothetical protein